jgi:hypothetical protein
MKVLESFPEINNFLSHVILERNSNQSIGISFNSLLS